MHLPKLGEWTHLFTIVNNFGEPWCLVVSPKEAVSAGMFPDFDRDERFAPGCLLYPSSMLCLSSDRESIQEPFLKQAAADN